MVGGNEIAATRLLGPGLSLHNKSTRTGTVEHSQRKNILFVLIVFVQVRSNRVSAHLSENIVSKEISSHLKTILASNMTSIR